MFSGGLLSSNLTRSFGKIRNRQKSQLKRTSRISYQSECNLNWDEYDTRKKNSPNTKSAYTLEVKGKIELASYPGCLLLCGIAILLMASVATHLFAKNLLGPIGIGIGIYAIMIAICWLLDNRDRSKKFFHIQDLYSKYATKKYEKVDKGVQVDRYQKESDSKGVTKFEQPQASKTQIFDNNSKNAKSPAIVDDAKSESEEVSPLIDRDTVEKDNIMDNDKQTGNSDTVSTKIHPELIKRSSMQKLSYDITFKNIPPLKVTDF